MKKRGNIFLRFFCVGVIVWAICSIVTSQFKINKLTALREELERKYILVQDEVDEMRYDLDRPIDENYIIEFAREKLGLHLPGETIFHYEARK